MILILSFFGYEQCTDPVIDWLLYYKAPFLKLTQQDLYDSSKVSIDITNRRIIFNGVDLIKEVRCVYFRRFEDNINLNLRSGYPMSQALFELKYELNDLIKHIFFLLKEKIWFPAPYNVSIDKLTSILYAQDCGLKVPKCLISNNKQDLVNFLSKYPSSIIKPIRFSGYYIMRDTTYNVYTNSISVEDITQLECDIFFPSLIQEKVNKDFEIRAFYLDGNIYASAIIVDDKNYDDVKRIFGSEHIRWIPFKFPYEIENKIKLFMNKLSLNTGSLDIIKTVDGEFTFIEVNPVGQFMAPSNRCNFDLEKLIAKWLIKNGTRQYLLQRRTS